MIDIATAVVVVAVGGLACNTSRRTASSCVITNSTIWRIIKTSGYLTITRIIWSLDFIYVQSYCGCCCVVLRSSAIRTAIVVLAVVVVIIRNNFSFFHITV